MTTTLIILASFVAVAALVAGVMMLFRNDNEYVVEDRLSMLTQTGSFAAGKADEKSVLARPIDDTLGGLEAFVARFGNLRLFLEQAGLAFTPPQFFLATAGCAAAGAALCFFARVNVAVIPIAALCAAALPAVYVLVKRKHRLGQFAKQLPEALELISRALRAGHSLAAGFHLVAEEMADPIAKEFQRVYEEQNLGVSLEEALESMTERVPNLDLRFFATAVILQRQTGGDLAEILDKIGHLVRERFKIWGQIQALTGEGRLSGIVLLALPPVLFLVMYRLNPKYTETLWTDPLGKQMLAFALVMQLVGAIVIRKIINIKV